MRADGEEPGKRRERWTSEQLIVKSVSIKGAERKPGGCARKAVGLTSGGLRRVSDEGLGEPRGSSNRGAGVSRGRSRAVQSDHSSGALAGNGRKRFGLAGPATAV